MTSENLGGTSAPDTTQETVPTLSEQPAPGWLARTSTRTRILLAVAVAAVIAVIVVIVIVATQNAGSPFESAMEECNIASNEFVSLRDEGDTLIVDTEGDESEGAQVATAACLFIELDVPDSLVARMDSTRALDGVQTGEFHGITAQWSYHPNNGLDVIFTR